MSPKGTNNATCFLSACNTKCHAEDFEGEITGFKCSHTQSHRYTQAPHPSFLMQNASSPEPQTQFSTLLWASAVNSPARRGNRQHLSQATRWRNAVCVTAGFKVRLQPRWRKPKIPFYRDIFKKKNRNVPKSFSHCHMWCLHHSEKASLIVPEQQNISTFRGAPAANEHKS